MDYVQICATINLLASGMSQETFWFYKTFGISYKLEREGNLQISFKFWPRKCLWMACGLDWAEINVLVFEMPQESLLFLQDFWNFIQIEKK